MKKSNHKRKCFSSYQVLDDHCYSLTKKCCRKTIDETSVQSQETQICDVPTTHEQNASIISKTDLHVDDNYSTILEIVDNFIAVRKSVFPKIKSIFKEVSAIRSEYLKTFYMEKQCRLNGPFDENGLQFLGELFKAELELSDWEKNNRESSKLLLELM